MEPSVLYIALSHSTDPLEICQISPRMWSFAMHVIFDEIAKLKYCKVWNFHYCLWGGISSDYIVVRYFSSWSVYHVSACNTFTLRKKWPPFCRQDFQIHLLEWNEKGSLLIQIWLKFVTKSLINTKPSLVQRMAWCRGGNKPLSEPMMI